MVDCGGDPSAAEDITGLSVHQYETAERVIDLDDLQWAGGNETTLDEPRVLVRGCLPLSTSYPVFPLASVDRPFQEAERRRFEGRIAALVLLRDVIQELPMRLDLRHSWVLEVQVNDLLGQSFHVRVVP